MEDEKIVFYGFGKEKVPILFKMLNNSLNTSITINEDEKNKALYNITLKDIKLLDNRLSEILTKIKEELAFCDVNFNNNYSLDKINALLDEIEKIQKKLIVEGNVKISLFSSDKKKKRQVAENKLRLSNDLIKYQTEILSIKNEYDILKKRKNDIKFVQKDETYKDDDVLSRTVNFYMNK